MPQNFSQINYSCRHVNWFVVSIHVLLQLSVFYHHHEENEASYAVWLSCLNMLSFLWVPDWFASHHTLCLQECFVQVNQRVLKQRISIMDTAHPKEVASHPIHPPWISPCKVSCFLKVWVLRSAPCKHLSSMYTRTYISLLWMLVYESCSLYSMKVVLCRYYKEQLS